MVSVGNHEYDYTCSDEKGCGSKPAPLWAPHWSGTDASKQSYGECGVPYSARFHMPDAAVGGVLFPPEDTGLKNTRNLYYSFDAGHVHYVMMSAETDCEFRLYGQYLRISPSLPL